MTLIDVIAADKSREGNELRWHLYGLVNGEDVRKNREHYERLTKLYQQERREAKLAALRRSIDEGDGSGVAMGNVFVRVRKKLGIGRTKPPATNSHK